MDVFNSYGGFLVVSGGSEKEYPEGSPDHYVSKQFGFCMQRTKLDRSQIGEFTKYQARLQCNGDARAGDELLDSILSRRRSP